MSSKISMASSDSDVFYVEQISNEPSLQRNNLPNIFNSTEISRTYGARMPSVSSLASRKPQLFTINDNSNESTMPYRFGRQLPIVPPGLNDLNLPPNPFNILITMAVVTQTQDDNDGYSPKSPEPSDPSPISTLPMNVSTFNSWETPHTTTDDKPSIRRTSQDVYTGPHPWMKPLIPKTNLEENTYCPDHHRHPLLAR